jgi:hypothetical protein
MYTVRTVKDIMSFIIPPFEKYMLITQKRADFEIFKKIVLILANVRGLDMENFYKILNLKVNHNSISEELLNTFPNITPIPRPEFPFIGITDAQLLVGFILFFFLLLLFLD